MKKTKIFTKNNGKNLAWLNGKLVQLCLSYIGNFAAHPGRLWFKYLLGGLALQNFTQVIYTDGVISNVKHAYFICPGYWGFELKNTNKKNVILIIIIICINSIICRKK